MNCEIPPGNTPEYRASIGVSGSIVHNFVPPDAATRSGLLRSYTYSPAFLVHRLHQYPDIFRGREL